MRRIIISIIMLTLLSGTAMADSIAGRFGIFGKAGILVPVKDEFISSTSEAKTGFATGGGLIYGINNNLAAELDVTHAIQLDVETSGSKVFEAALTDISLGVQYRFTPERRMVPYLGAGVDVLTGDLEHVNGTKYDLKWTAGGHVNAGLDWFLTRSISVNADIRGVIAAKGDIKRGDTKVGEYDPATFVGTVGLRLFLPDKL